MTSPQKFFKKIGLVVNMLFRNSIVDLLTENRFKLTEEDPYKRVYLLAHPELAGWCLEATNEKTFSNQWGRVDLKVVETEIVQDQDK